MPERTAVKRAAAAARADASAGRRRALTGRCTCGDVRYRLAAAPLFVHACHCHWCQRETGSAFAVNAMIEAARIDVRRGEAEIRPAPTASGRSQWVARCAACAVVLWRRYGSADAVIAYLRVGTLDAPDRWPPLAHVFVASKQPWFELPRDARTFRGHYDARRVWPASSLQRLAAARPAAQ